MMMGYIMSVCQWFVFTVRVGGAVAYSFLSEVIQFHERITKDIIHLTQSDVRTDYTNTFLNVCMHK